MRRADGSAQRRGQLLRHTTSAVFLLLGVSAYLMAALTDAGVAKGVLQSIGGFLLGTVVVGFAYQYFLNEESEERTVAKLDEVLAGRMDHLFPGADRHGFAGFVGDAPRRAFADLKRGDEVLWLDTYSPDLRVYADGLADAVRGGSRVKMLVIDPDSEVARMRADEIAPAGYDATKFCSATRDFLAVLDDLATGLQDDAIGQLEIRTYSDLPGMPMYLRRDRHGRRSGMSGFYLSEPSFGSTHIGWVDAPQGVLAEFCAYFDQKWERQPPRTDTRAPDAPARTTLP